MLVPRRNYYYDWNHLAAVCQLRRTRTRVFHIPTIVRGGRCQACNDPM